MGRLEGVPGARQHHPELSWGRGSPAILAQSVPPVTRPSGRVESPLGCLERGCAGDSAPARPISRDRKARCKA
eukprot:3013465-Alexandrium_andersonii.AAC.1